MAWRKMTKPPNDLPPITLPKGLTRRVTLLWGAAYGAHPAGGHPMLDWLALGVNADRQAHRLSVLMDARYELATRRSLSAWTPSLWTPALVWWPTVEVLDAYPDLQIRVTRVGKAVGVYLYPDVA